jgi:glucokinase
LERDVLLPEAIVNMSKTENLRAAENKTWIGVDIGGTKTAVALCSKPPAIAARIEFPTLPARGPERVLDLIKKAIYKLISQHRLSYRDLAAIGISCGGPLDRIAGVIQAPPNLSTWVDVPILSILQHEFNLECRLENDANAGAIAEHRFGAGQGTQHMVFLTMGTGLGAGIITDGRLYHGASDLAGEVGHVRLTRTGPIGHGKAGSVEGWASGGGMAEAARRRVTAAVKKGVDTSLAAQTADGTLTARDVAEAARGGDKLAKRIIHDTGSRLGQALAIVVDLLNPEVIVLGGLAMRLGDSLMAPARRMLETEALDVSVRACRIVPAALGGEIGDIAAICVAMGF